MAVKPSPFFTVSVQLALTVPTELLSEDAIKALAMTLTPMKTGY